MNALNENRDQSGLCPATSWLTNNRVIGFVRRRPGLIAILISWVALYVYSEQGESERDTAIVLVMIYLFASFWVVVFNLITLQIRISDTSLIVFLLLVIDFAGSRNIIYHADMTAKSMYFSLFKDACKPVDSDYLNGLGIKFCYGWAYYPQARLILLSPNVDLSKAIHSWPGPIISAFSQKNETFHWIVDCGSVEINRPTTYMYYIHVNCQ